MSLLGITPPPWMDDAACLDHPHPDIFFPTPGGTARPAQAVCDTCPVKDNCAQYAINLERAAPHRGRAGIFGGLTPTERAQISQQSRAS
jgi:WhiB family redox-sensing transcriptional regulator